jgi:hypothetical protein
MSKKVAFNPAPLAKPGAKQGASADAWVGKRSLEAAPEPLKRLTLDIPASLHARIKSTCAMEGKKMVEEITVLLKEKWPAA